MRLIRWLLSILFVDVKQWEVIPRCYGVAWVNVWSGCAVAMPIPLNLIVGPLRTAWKWAKCEAWRLWENDQAQRCPHCGRDRNMKGRLG